LIQQEKIVKIFVFFTFFSGEKVNLISNDPLFMVKLKAQSNGVHPLLSLSLPFKQSKN